ncbi:hypothetical protein K0M31_003934 [Melipona bicolor]|uniref:Uncharacterized protein n=1 Tax=Melipona bicolor TaxID=60889 RepID=A0AA40KNY4_9HYME|nr:hypothetical protein K0M31_003934 [Melipona bicolor]
MTSNDTSFKYLNNPDQDKVQLWTTIDREGLQVNYFLFRVVISRLSPGKVQRKCLTKNTTVTRITPGEEKHVLVRSSGHCDLTMKRRLDNGRCFLREHIGSTCFLPISRSTLLLAKRSTARETENSDREVFTCVKQRGLSTDPAPRVELKIRVVPHGLPTPSRNSIEDEMEAKWNSSRRTDTSPE